MAALEALLGTSVVDGKGQQIAVRQLTECKKVVGLYFSAHWCPPCRQFTPVLAQFYDDLNENDASQFEVVFVSSDRDEASWREYFGEMPWLALPFSDRDRKQTLAAKYGVSGIPTLIVLDAQTATVITAEGRRKVTENPRGFPWK